MKTDDIRGSPAHHHLLTSVATTANLARSVTRDRITSTFVVPRMIVLFSRSLRRLYPRPIHESASSGCPQEAHRRLSSTLPAPTLPEARHQLTEEEAQIVTPRSKRAAQKQCPHRQHPA